MLRSWTQAARRLALRPWFTLSAVLILGAGIAATTGVFSVVDTAVLRPLPYPNPDRLVMVLEANTAKSDAAGLLAPVRLEDWNRLNRSFSAISGSYNENMTETSGDLPERLPALRVAPRFFSVYATHAAVGRTPTSEEEAFGGPSAVVISDGFWARRFQRRADVTSQHLMLGGQRYAIVGVMPATFAVGGAGVDLWIPAQFAPGMLAARDARFLTGIGRMKPGVRLAAAQRDLSRVQAELGQAFPRTDKDWSAQLTDLKGARTAQVRQPLLFILGSVGMLLLIALANTAGLMLTHLQRRETELAIRGLLGATRLQVVAAVVQEILIIAAAAVVLASVTDVVLLRMARASLASLPRASELAIDWRALIVASLCGMCAAVVCGALPAWRATRRGIAATVTRIGRGTSSDSRSQRALVGGQIAVATVLLCSTALMLRSYHNLTHEDPGFDAGRSVTFHVGAGWGEDRAAVARMQLELLNAFRNIPGVTNAGFANFLPASNATIRYQVDLGAGAASDRANGRDHLTVGERSITDGYLPALGAHMAAGTTCPNLAVVQANAPKVLVNRRFVQEYAGGRNVVGQLMHWTTDRPTMPASEIVGVVDDVREDNLRTPAVPYVYSCIVAGGWPDPEYVVRTNGNPRALLAAIRGAVHDVAPARAVFGLMTLQDDLDDTLDQTRLQTTVIAAFGLAAVALAVIGLYGLVALAVATRRREIGIRIALGASPRRVVGEVAAHVGWLLAGGAVVGLLDR